MNRELNTLMLHIARQVKDLFEWSKKGNLTPRGQTRVREIVRMLEKEAVDAANYQMATGKNKLMKVSRVLESLRAIKPRSTEAFGEAADAEWLGEWALERSEAISSECGISDDEALEQAQNSQYVN